MHSDEQTITQSRASSSKNELYRRASPALVDSGKGIRHVNMRLYCTLLYKVPRTIDTSTVVTAPWPSAFIQAMAKL